MIIRDKSYPHPVLSPFRDDVTPNTFSCCVTESHDIDNYYIDVTFDYDNATLTALINEGRAIHSVHIECRRNFFREITSFKSKSHRIAIKTTELVGRVEITGFIKSQLPINEYRIVGSHSDYENTSFAIQPGDLLAVASSQKFEAYVDYDPLNQISSVLTILRSEDIEDGKMKLDTTGPLLIATLSQKDFQRYSDLKADPKLAALVANQVIVPVLFEALQEIRDTSGKEDDFEEGMDKRWFRSIYKKMEDNGIDIRHSKTPVSEVVQTLLNLPLRRTLQELHQMNPLDENT